MSLLGDFSRFCNSVFRGTVCCAQLAVKGTDNSLLQTIALKAEPQNPEEIFSHCVPNSHSTPAAQQLKIAAVFVNFYQCLLTPGGF